MSCGDPADRHLAEHLAETTRRCVSRRERSGEGGDGDCRNAEIYDLLNPLFGRRNQLVEHCCWRRTPPKCPILCLALMRSLSRRASGCRNTNFEVPLEWWWAICRCGRRRFSHALRSGCGPIPAAAPRTASAHRPIWQSPALPSVVWYHPAGSRAPAPGSIFLQ